MSDSPIVDAPPERSDQLPDAVTLLEHGGRKLYVVGTAHVSKESVEDVARTLEMVQPDEVAVELCASRHQTLMDRESWSKLDIFKVLKEGKAALLLSSLLMSSFQRRIADQLGVVPGAEMLEAIQWAGDNERELALIDRDIQTTLKRTWRGLGFLTKLKAMMQLFFGLFAVDEIDKDTIEQLKEEGQLEDMLSGLATAMPEVKETLIDERDHYMAGKLRQTTGETVVAVVGAGHLPGIRREIENSQDLAHLDSLPKPSFLPKLLKWLIPIAVLALLAYGFYRGGVEESAGSVTVWFLVNGLLSALGAALAFGHPVTVVSAFLAAPITSLNPMVAAGWVAGLVQAWIKRPTVLDLENLPSDIGSLKTFWSNPVCRVLLVVVLANLGSTLGTIIGGSWIAARTF